MKLEKGDLIFSDSAYEHHRRIEIVVDCCLRKLGSYKFYWLETIHFPPLLNGMVIFNGRALDHPEYKTILLEKAFKIK